MQANYEHGTCIIKWTRKQTEQCTVFDQRLSGIQMNNEEIMKESGTGQIVLLNGLKMGRCFWCIHVLYIHVPHTVRKYYIYTYV